MSAAGVFKLIANDGKADRLILATRLLNERIKDIMCMRTKAGFDDPTPTLVDIEKTHIIFVNAHFKPFAAIAYEYNKVNASVGSPQFGQVIKFSIPQFGDFFHDMVAHTVLPSASTSAGTVPNIDNISRVVSGTNSQTVREVDGGEGVGLPVAIAGQVMVDGDAIAATRAAAAAAGLTSYKLNLYTRRYVNAAGATLSSGDVAYNHVRYCELPGLRLFSKVKFEINGNPLDEYDTNAYLFHNQFKVQPNKRVGWNRLVGQEVPIDAVSGVLEFNNTESLCSEGAVDVNGNAVGAGAGNDTVRQQTRVLNGPQTPKLVQPALEMWIPLLFWCNKDPRLSIASVSIPYGQRMIEVTFSGRDRLLQLAHGNVFLETRTECFELTGPGGDLTTGAAAANWTDLSAVGLDELVGYSQTLHRAGVVLADSSLVESSQNINITLYINNIFVNPEIHDIYIKRIGFSLIRVHRQQSDMVQNSSDEKLLSSFKWPIETIYTALQPTYNDKPQNANWHRDWHRFTRLHDESVYEKSHTTVKFSDNPGSIGATVATGSAAELLENGVTGCNATKLEKEFVYAKVEKTVSVIKISAHGIPIYNDIPAEFFSDYSPYHWGGRNIATPEDTGALMENFCLYPGTYQPSGHLNVSRAREFFFKYTSNYVGRTDAQNGPDDYPLASNETLRNAYLHQMAEAINFLLVSDGTAVLRYST